MRAAGGRPWASAPSACGRFGAAAGRCGGPAGEAGGCGLCPRLCSVTTLLLLGLEAPPAPAPAPRAASGVGGVVWGEARHRE